MTSERPSVLISRHNELALTVRMVTSLGLPQYTNSSQQWIAEVLDSGCDISALTGAILSVAQAIQLDCRNRAAMIFQKRVIAFIMFRSCYVA